MTTSLNEPFRDKTEAKHGGAQPDSEASKWFLPIGCDLEPFTTAARQSEHACQAAPAGVAARTDSCWSACEGPTGRLQP